MRLLYTILGNILKWISRLGDQGIRMAREDVVNGITEEPPVRVKLHNSLKPEYRRLLVVTIAQKCHFSKVPEYQSKTATKSIR
jgi:hypothetical protein